MSTGRSKLNCELRRGRGRQKANTHSPRQGDSAGRLTLLSANGSWMPGYQSQLWSELSRRPESSLNCQVTATTLTLTRIMTDCFVSLNAPYSLVRLIYEKRSKIDHSLTVRLIIQCAHSAENTVSHFPPPTMGLC